MKVKVNVYKNGSKEVMLKSESSRGWNFDTISKEELEELKACEYVTSVAKVEPNSWDVENVVGNRSIENLYRIDYDFKFDSKGEATMGAVIYHYVA